MPATRSGGGWLAAGAARRVGAFSGNAPHPSAWLRQSATLPFEEGRDRRLTRNGARRMGGAYPSSAKRGGWLAARAVRRVGAFSGNAPHPSAWLRQSATLPFEEGRDRRLTRNGARRMGGAYPCHAQRGRVARRGSGETGGGLFRQRTPPVRWASPIGHPPL